MKLLRRQFLLLTAGVTATQLVLRIAFAFDYPSRTVRLLVGFPPGGPTDILARLLGHWLSRQFGQPFVIENRAGAGGTIGIKAVIAAPADGYTLLLVPSSATINSLYYPHLNFNLVRDIAPVCGVMLEPLVVVVNPLVPAKTIPEFIAYAKSAPGNIIMASIGNGTTPQFAGELFKVTADIELLHVPYRGAAPAITDLLAGRAQVMFAALSDLIGYIKSGKLRALAVTSANRSPLFPDLPTLGQFLPGYEASAWFGVGAPRQTPIDVIEPLNKEINAALVDPDFSANLGKLGGIPLKGTPDDFEKLFVSDTQKWAQVMRTAKIKPEQ